MIVVRRAAREGLLPLLTVMLCIGLCFPDAGPLRQPLHTVRLTANHGNRATGSHRAAPDVLHRRIGGAGQHAVTARSIGGIAIPRLPAGARASVTILGVTVDNSSVKIRYTPVAGAKDYRVVDLADPTVVKYAGLVHLYAGDGRHFALQPDGVTPIFPYRSVDDAAGGSGPARLDVPATQIEWNRVADGQAHRVVVEAVDTLGPVPPASIDRAGSLRSAASDEALHGATSGQMVTPGGAGTMAAMAMLGSNSGPTADGHISINGQGNPSNAPRAIARSAPLVVRADRALAPIPSRAGATQSFLDTFDDAEAASLRRIGPVDPVAGVMTYTLGAGTPKAWTIQYQNVDTTDSMPMIEDGHFMDTLFDGGTPGTNNPLHVSHAVMAMSPNQIADLSGGKLLHLTMEVDGHESARRWVAFNLAPANDPLVGWYTANAAINRSNTALFAQVFPDVYRIDLFDGGHGTPLDVPLTGAAGQAPSVAARPSALAAAGLDNRARFDLFLTRTHLALFEDGALVAQSDIPGGLPFSAAKVYFSHYLYHTANDHNELLQYTPWEQYWINDFPWSDERHWDNMGFEVLPASDVPADWSTLAGLIR